MAPTSGNMPIPVSGIAKTAFGLATRMPPWIESPIPPPMQIPSMTAT